MTQMTESTAEGLSPARAAELARVLDLQSRWENLRAEGTPTTARLQALQVAFEAYRVSMAKYTDRDRSEPNPEMSPTKPDRLGAWCRTIRAVLRRADGSWCPTHIVAKVHWAADRIATRVKAEPTSRESPTDMAAAIRQLDAVIAWCDGLGDDTGRCMQPRNYR